MFETLTFWVNEIYTHFEKNFIPIVIYGHTGSKNFTKSTRKFDEEEIQQLISNLITEESKILFYKGNIHEGEGMDEIFTFLGRNCKPWRNNG